MATRQLLRGGQFDGCCPYDHNEERPHQGRWCFGKTPIQTFLNAIPLAREKMIAA
jgi:hypothetical protein